MTDARFRQVPLEELTAALASSWGILEASRKLGTNAFQVARWCRSPALWRAYCACRDRGELARAGKLRLFRQKQRDERFRRMGDGE